ncbi:MAG: hypothetical protein ABMA14_13020 [Hyphomonadaceae bacterium]
MVAATGSSKRPGAITGICMLGFLGVVALGALALMGGLDSAPPWYPPYLALSAVIGLTALVGLWRMRRWGFFLYAGLLVLSQLVLVSAGAWSIQSLVVPLIVTIIASRSLGQMR